MVESQLWMQREGGNEKEADIHHSDSDIGMTTRDAESGS